MGIAISTHLPPPVMMESTEVRRCVTHMLCCSWAMCFSAAASSENDQGSKKTLLASEQDRPDIKAAREEWTTTRQPRMRLEPHRLVFLDETGTTTKMTRLRGCCPKGQRLRCKAPFGHWMTQTFVASPPSSSTPR